MRDPNYLRNIKRIFTAVDIRPIHRELRKDENLWNPQCTDEVSVTLAETRATGQLHANLKFTNRRQKIGRELGSNEAGLLTQLSEVNRLLRRFSDELQGDLGRVTLAQIRPAARLDLPIHESDAATVWLAFAISSPCGISLNVGEERSVLQQGEVWRFDQFQTATIINESAAHNIIIIFEILSEIKNRETER